MLDKKLLISLALLCVIPLTSVILIHYHFISPVSIKSTVEKFGALAPIIFICIFIIATLFFVPGMPLSLAGGLIFGLSHGVLYNVIGTALGASCAFLLARYCVQDWIREKAGDRLQIIMRGINKNGWRYVALLRLMPLTPFTLLNYIFGTTSIPLKHFILVTFIFSLPGCYAFAYIGHLGNQILSSDVLHINEMLLGLGLLAALLFIVQVVKSFYLDK